MVVRLGVRPSSGGLLAGAGYRRILQGQVLTLHTISDAAVAVRAWVRVIYDDGSGQLLTVPETVRSGGRVAEVLASTDVVTQNGWVVNAEVEMLTTGIKRGQTYVRLAVEPFGCVLLQDYCFFGGNVSLGTYVQSGPGGGSGHLQTVEVKASSVPVASTTVALVSTNTIRKVHGFAWYYNASADAASRILTVVLNHPLGALPVGFSAGTPSVVWASAALTLTTGQEGTVFADLHRSGTNDAGTLAIADAAANPSPFPLWVAEGNNYFADFQVADLHANDRDTIYLLRETWVVDL